MVGRVSTILAIRDSRLRARIVSGALALIIAAAGFAVWYRATYAAWPGQGNPARVHWCGRDYQIDGSPQTWRRITSQDPSPIHAEGQYPPFGWWGQELFAVSPRMVLHGSGEPCAMVIYLSSGAGQYQGYGLEGGP
jgi:hypothetical protein